MLIPRSRLDKLRAGVIGDAFNRLSLPKARGEQPVAYCLSPCASPLALRFFSNLVGDKAENG